MTEREALKHLKATIEAFGPDEGIELDQKAWSKLHSAIKEALAQPEQEPVYHLRQYGDVTKEELDRYLATGDINPPRLEQVQSGFFSREAMKAHSDGHVAQPEQKRPPNCGTGYCSCIDCVMEPEQEPVAYLAWKDGKPCYEGDDAVCEDAVWPVDGDDDRESMPVYTTPPQRTWVGLTRPERSEIEKAMLKYYDYQHECKTVCLPEFAAAIEAKLKEKNT